MMTALVLAMHALLSVGSSQNLPALAGRWVLLPSSDQTVSAPFGDTFTATQNQQTLQLSFLMSVATRGGHDDRRVDLSLAFDGSRTNTATIVELDGGGKRELFDTTKWEGARLIVSRYERLNGRPDTLFKRYSLFLDSDATLLVETSNYEGGRLNGTTQSHYRRQRASPGQL